MRVLKRFDWDCSSNFGKGRAVEDIRLKVRSGGIGCQSGGQGLRLSLVGACNVHASSADRCNVDGKRPKLQDKAIEVYRRVGAARGDEVDNSRQPHRRGLANSVIDTLFRLGSEYPCSASEKGKLFAFAPIHILSTVINDWKYKLRTYMS